MCLDLPELVEQLVVLKDFQVLHVIVRLVVALKLLLGLAWVDAFQDAQLSEVLKRQLHLANCMASGEVLGCFALDTLFDFLHFYL